MNSSQCKHCQSSGLAILPVRYAPAPWRTAVIPTLPEWADDPAGPIGFSDPKQREPAMSALGNEFKYTLRILRAGYLYLYYEKRHITSVGEVQWLCYTVFDDGSVFPSQPDDAAPPAEHPACDSSAHLGALLRQVIVMEPHNSPPVWIAFSEHRWTEATRNRYAQDVALRQKRMQCIDPKALLKSPKGPRLTAATAENLQSILEYKPRVRHDTIPFAEEAQAISTGDYGAYDVDRLQTVSTRYKLAVRAGEAYNEAHLMRFRTEDENGHSKAGIILALHDAVGMVHELNGFRSDAAGAIAKYSDERALQLAALNSMEGIRRVMVQPRAQAQGEQYILNGPSVLDERVTELEGMVQRLPDDAHLQGQLAQTKALQAQMRAAAPTIALAFGKHRAEQVWLSYEDHLQPNMLQDFKDNYERLLKVADKLIDARTMVLIKWLEAERFIHALNDYDPKDVSDGLAFEEMAGYALVGIDSSASGRARLDAWVKEAKSTVESNLLWRTVALNQQAAKAELDAVLAEAWQHKKDFTEASVLNWVNYTAKSMKALSDIYKKAQRVFDDNAKANAPATDSKPAGDKVFGVQMKPVNTRGTDRFAISVGDRVFRWLRIDKLGDFASEKIIQHLFSIRGFVNPADSVNLIIQQAKSDKLSRAQTLERLRAARTFMQMPGTPDMHAGQTLLLKDAWGKFKNSEKGPTAIKDARLAVVVGLIEGVNFAKMMAECKAKNDMKSWFSLLASGMSITSALFDVAAVAAKGAIPTTGNPNWTYQRLKMWGGVMSGAASLIGGAFDLLDAQKSKAKGYDDLMLLYALKGSANVVSGALTLAVAACNSAALVGRLTGRSVLGTAVNNVGKRAAAWLAFRILGMALGGWVTAGIFAAQLVIWWATPDALEDWMSHSAFGKQRSKKTDGYQTVEDQESKLLAALVELGYMGKPITDDQKSGTPSRTNAHWGGAGIGGFR